MAKEKKVLAIHECVEVAERLASGFEEAVDASKETLTPNARLLVGIRGALNAMRAETEVGWIHTTLTRTLAHLGVSEDAGEA